MAQRQLFLPVSLLRPPLKVKLARIKRIRSKMNVKLLFLRMRKLAQKNYKMQSGKEKKMKGSRLVKRREKLEEKHATRLILAEEEVLI